jgi:ABC-type sugar transport systems, permease components
VLLAKGAQNTVEKLSCLAIKNSFFQKTGILRTERRKKMTDVKPKTNTGFMQKIKEKMGNGDISVWFMMLPSILMLIIVSIYPFVWIFRYVAYEYDGFVAYYTGLDNIKRAFSDTLFWNSVVHTFEYALLKLAFTLPLALIAAVVLNQKLRGSNLFRGIFFLPTVISAAVYSLIFYFIFASYNGVLNGMLKAIGLIKAPVDWLGNPAIAMFAVVIVAIWGGYGNYMILFISGLASIPDDVYESSKIDGANAIQTFFKITLPMLGPMLKVILMLAITTALKDYESILVLTGGGPNNRTSVMFSYIYQLSFGSDSNSTAVQIGYGAVLSIIAAIIIGIVTVIYLRASKKLDDVY